MLFLQIAVSIPASVFVSRTSKYAAARLLPLLLKNLRLNGLCLNDIRIDPSSLLKSNTRKMSSTYRQSMWREHPILVTLSTNQFINTSAIEGAIGEPILYLRVIFFVELQNSICASPVKHLSKSVRFNPWNSPSLSAKILSSSKYQDLVRYQIYNAINRYVCEQTFDNQTNTLFCYNQVHGQLSFWKNLKYLLLWLRASAVHLKILTAMRRIDRWNCQSSRELASMEYVFVVFVNFWKSVLEWRQHLVRFNYNHFRLEHL